MSTDVYVRPARALSRELDADPHAPRAVRRMLRSWLGEWGVSDDGCWEILQATDEAVANVAEHAYAGRPGSLRVECTLVDGDPHDQVVVVVRDHGRWRPPAADPGFRGRGLQLMRTCCEQVGIELTEHGTVVTLVSRLPVGH